MVKSEEDDLFSRLCIVTVIELISSRVIWTERLRQESKKDFFQVM